MGRSKSPSPVAESSRSKSPKTNSGNRIQKKSSQQNWSISKRLHDITTEEFIKFFRLQGDKITIYVGCHMPGYSVPRKFFCQKSAYFADLFEKTRHTIMRLDFEAPDAFEVILQSMFTEKITVPAYESQFKPSKAITKYLDIIKMTSILQLDSDLLARNAASVVWRLIRTHPSKIRNKHLKIIFEDSWPKGWAFDNVRKEFVKEMAEEWVDVAVGSVVGKKKKYDLDAILKRDVEVAKLVLGAVGELLGKRAWNTGVHPLTGKFLQSSQEAEVAEDVEEQQEEEENLGEENEDEEMGDCVEDGEIPKEAEGEAEHTSIKTGEKPESVLAHGLSENGRYWEVIKKGDSLPRPEDVSNVNGS